MQGIHLDTVDSTNNEAKRLVRSGRIHGPAYVAAREQTAGKGNHGRHWVSPKDAGIYVSLLEFAPNPAVPPSTLFTLAAGVACAEVFRDTTDLDIRLKPVNDLYLDGKKLGGILVESIVESGCVACVILGVGINTHGSDRPIPKDHAQPVSLEEAMDHIRFATLDFDILRADLIKSMRSWNVICWSNQTQRVRDAWMRLCVPGARCPI